MPNNHIPTGRGVKQGEDAEKFRDGILQPNVVPDRVSAVVTSYFRIPAVWIGEQPPLLPFEDRPLTWGHETVLRHSMKCGISTRVQRDGLFAFDFTNFAEAAHTIIPGFVHGAAPYQAPKEHQEAVQQAERIAVYRAQIINAHQACLTTAEKLVYGGGGFMGYPINAWNTFKSLKLDDVPTYNDDVEDERAVARNVYNNIYQNPRCLNIPRRVLRLDVVAKSFDLLDQILASPPVAVAMVEGAYMAASRVVERRFGESVVLGWTVCEQLISIAWQRLLDSKKSPETTNSMNGKRVEKLTGRDYTASIMTEVLELNGLFSSEIYGWLETGRKARNHWAHDMKTPKITDVFACLSATCALFKQLLGIDLYLQTGSRGEAPQWNIWMLPQNGL